MHWMTADSFAPSYKGAMNIVKFLAGFENLDPEWT
jgi:hypothetical protein